MPASQVDRLVLLVASGRQSGDLIHHLRREKFHFTLIDSAGGFVLEPVVCLLVGLNQARMEELLQIVRTRCKPHRTFVPSSVNLQPGFQSIPMIEAQVGGALVHVINVEQFIQI
jgi:uncharacterized protein YaaQ